MGRQLSDIGHVVILAAGLFVLGVAAFVAAWLYTSGPAETFFVLYGTVATGLACFLGLGTVVALPPLSVDE